MAINRLCANITFFDKDLEGVVMPHDDPLVVELSIAGCLTKRVLIDNGSQINVFHFETFKQMELPQSIRPSSGLLVGSMGLEFEQWELSTFWFRYKL